ncbi:MAG: hypothetical protein LBR10_00070 [Prevotellaceae bacterium]|jgi:hypothetical protein|nr:hypothetical protein [Prevotellaceae bacterium]
MLVNLLIVKFDYVVQSTPIRLTCGEIYKGNKHFGKAISQLSVMLLLSCKEERLIGG